MDNSHQHAAGCARAGQAMIESVIVMMVICLVLFGVFQLAHAFAAREVLRHAAVRTARARAVGFNAWMCTKVMRVASIPNAGEMISPQVSFVDPALRTAIATMPPGSLWDWSLGSTPRSERAAFEAARIPDYLASENHARAGYILDYANWDDIRGDGLGGSGATSLATDTLEISVRQDYPLSILVRMLFEWAGQLTPAMADGRLRLRGEGRIENHYPLYLNDEGR